VSSNERTIARWTKGWSTAEYLAVLLGLIVVWQGAQFVLALIREHHDEFSWALMIPF
jgi:hypothetical protein